MVDPDRLAAFLKWAKTENVWPFGQVTANGEFHHFFDADTDNAWIGFNAAWDIFKPVYQCKDFADGWIDFTDFAEALKYHDDTGCAMRIKIGATT